MKKILLTFALVFPILAAGQQKVHFVVSAQKTSSSDEPKVVFTTPVAFANEVGKTSLVLSFPGKTAQDLYYDVLLRAVRFFKSMPVSPQTIEGKAFILSGETDGVRYEKKGVDGTPLGGYIAYLEYHVLFEFKDGGIRVHAPIISSGQEYSVLAGGKYKTYLSNIYEDDQNAIHKIEQFFDDMLNNIALPNKEDNW